MAWWPWFKVLCHGKNAGFVLQRPPSSMNVRPWFGDLNHFFMGPTMDCSYSKILFNCQSATWCLRSNETMFHTKDESMYCYCYDALGTSCQSKQWSLVPIGAHLFIIGSVVNYILLWFNSYSSYRKEIIDDYLFSRKLPLMLEVSHHYILNQIWCPLNA